MKTGVNVTVMKEKIFVSFFKPEGGTGWLKAYCILKTGSLVCLEKRKLIVGEIRPGLSIGLEIIFWTVFGHWM